MPKHGLRKVSKKRAKQMAQYRKEVGPFLDGKTCAWPGCQAPATENHHAGGRENELLLYKPWWRPACRFHHTYATEHSREAIEVGFSLPRNTKI